ncbi:MAG: ABC transporter permease, partial [Sphingomonas sp.]|nr:ABC transporter permease [Sphingomonas sp.]
MIRNRLIRQTLTIARRDFIATVFTPLFLVFLLSPLIMIGFGVVGAVGGSTLARGSADRDRVVVIAPLAEKPALESADARLRSVFRPDEAPPTLRVEAPAGPVDSQARAAFDARDYETSAVLYGPFDHPTIVYGP